MMITRPKMLFIPTLPLLLLLLIGHSTITNANDSQQVYALILEKMPDVIYKMRGEMAHENYGGYEHILKETSEKIYHAYMAEQRGGRKKPIVGQQNGLKEKIQRTLKETQIFMEQVHKVFLHFELKKQIIKEVNRAKEGGGKMVKNLTAEMLGENIKNALLLEASKQFGIQQQKDDEQGTDSEEWANIKEIVAILVAQHGEEIAAIANGDGDKKGAKGGGVIGGRKLRIAQVAPIHSPYPPRKYGGLERVVSYLTEELVRRGHEVTLISAADSVTSAKLIFKWHSLLATNQLDKHNESNQWLIETALEHSRRGEFDIVHLHTECHWDRVEQMVKEGKTQVVVTLHYLMKSKALSPLGTAYSNIPLIPISEDQRQHRPEGMESGEWKPHFLKTIYHGLPAGMYKFVDSKEQAENLKAKGERPYLAYIGRFSARKRTDVAIEIASKAGMRLKIAGVAFDEEYWRLTLLPLIVRTNFEHRQREKTRNGGGGEEMGKKLALLDDAHKKYVHLVHSHLKPLKEQREREQLGLWEYLAKFDGNNRHRQRLDAMETAYFGEITQIVGAEQAAKLTGDRTDLVEYVGEIGDEGKKDLLGNAAALLFPCYWTEPFGIVMIEAMAFGTPVVSRKMGSVGEVIKPGISGLIFDTVDEGVQAVKRVLGGAIDRARVRREFDERFTVEKMVDGYERAFHHLMMDNRGDGAGKEDVGEGPAVGG